MNPMPMMGLVATTTFALAASLAAGVAPADLRGRWFAGIHRFSGWAREDGTQPGEITLISPEIRAPLAWDQLIVSWNADMPAGTYLRVEARALYSGHATKWYGMGAWALDDAKHPRGSVADQRDGDGAVEVDTLALARPATTAQVRLILGGSDAKHRPKLRFVGLSFTDTKAAPTVLAPERRSGTRTLDVPERSQRAYAGGEGWCSPACVSMVLAYWALKTKRPELDHDIPEAARGIFDQTWGGTGNWPFNTAYAGALPGMRAYVTRLGDASELQEWIEAGVPVIVSHSYALLNGGDTAKASGHLLVCVGFTETGDVVVNDPWPKPDEGGSVRRVIARERLLKAWVHSHNTVYLIYPERHHVPRDRFGHWDGGR